MQKLYLARLANTFAPGQTYSQRSTARIPLDIPYFIDNVWEWLRPDYAPSRRHAVFATKTPEAALQRARTLGGNCPYVVCEIDFEVPMKGVRIASLSINSASEHTDIHSLPRTLANGLGMRFADLPLADKQRYSTRFLPGVTKEQMSEFFDSTPQLQQIGKRLAQVSTFWRDAYRGALDFNGSFIVNSGELFFDVEPGNSFRMTQVLD